MAKVIQSTFPNSPTWEQKCRAAWDENKRLGFEAKGLRIELATANAVKGELSEQLGAPRVVDDVDVDAEIDALTEVIRAAKAIRRRWRGE